MQLSINTSVNYVNCDDSFAERRLAPLMLQGVVTTIIIDNRDSVTKCDFLIFLKWCNIVSKHERDGPIINSTTPLRDIISSLLPSKAEIRLKTPEVVCDARYMLPAV